MKFKPEGPPRYAHQMQILRRIIETKGVCALLCEPGCISGEAELSVNRGGKGFRISMKDLVHMQNGGRRSGHAWNLKTPTRIQRRAEDGTIRLVEIISARSSGVKTTYTVTTADGKSIRATDEHPFLTEQGWKRLDELQAGMRTYVRTGQKAGGRQVKPIYREVAGLYAHPYARGKNRKTSRYRVAEHRLVAEARLNEVDLDTHVSNIRSGEIEGVQFLDPKQWAVHHIDRDPANNATENLEVLSHVEHQRKHAEEGTSANVLFKTELVQIVSIEKFGEEETFDIEVADEPHNFIADEFVVHNTGKTAPTLDYLSILALKSNNIVNSEREVRVLVISPKAAVDNWVLQAEKFVHRDVNVWAEALGGSIPQKAEAMRSRGPDVYRPRRIARRKDGQQLKYRGLNADRAELKYVRGATRAQGPAELRGKPRLVLLSTNYDMFASRSTRGNKTMADELMDAVRRFKPDVIVCDEMHKIKGHGSNTSRLVARIGALTPRRLGLTGTVMPHSPMDVFAQWRFLRPEAFGDYDPRLKGRRRATHGVFQRRFGVMGGFMGREVISFRNLDEMQAIMAENSIVVKKEDALDLPATVDTVVPVILSSKEQKIYSEMKQDLATQLTSGTASSENRLTQMLRLRQITAGHLPDDTGTVQTIGDSKVRTIASIAKDTLEGEKRIVVFGVFRHEIGALREALADSRTDVLVIDGSTPQDERLAIRRRFGSDDPARIILVAQIKTISLSVNELVTASNAIFASLSQQRDDLIQGRDRLNRIGQERPMTFWFPLARGTVDEVIYRSHQARTDLEAAVLKHVREIVSLPLAEIEE